MIPSFGHSGFFKLLTSSEMPSGSSMLSAAGLRGLDLFERRREVLERGIRRRGLNVFPLVFAHDRGGRHVVAQAQEHRVPRDSVVGPAGELHLGDQVGTHPVRALVGGRDRGEGALVDLALGEHLPDALQIRLGEAAADVAGVAQARRLAHAEQQRAQLRARAARLGPAADDHLLALDQLDLAPLGRALARAIARRAVLGDQPLPAVGQRLLVERGAVADRDLAEAQAIRAGSRRRRAARAACGARPAAARAGRARRGTADRRRRRPPDAATPSAPRRTRRSGECDPGCAGSRAARRRRRARRSRRRGSARRRPRPPGWRAPRRRATPPPRETARSCRCRAATRSARARAPPCPRRARLRPRRGCRRTFVRRPAADRRAARSPASPAWAAADRTRPPS